MTSDLFDQHGYQVRFDWGPEGLRAIGRGADVIIVIDVLSFSTAVDIGVGRGAEVYPAPMRDERATALARRHDALLAVPRAQMSRAHPHSLSPASLSNLHAGDRLVLPSPNGAAVSLAAMEEKARVLSGCLRNVDAVAERARQEGRVIAIVACGERWPDRSLRPCLEDLLAAGAVIDRMGDRLRSPEARAVVAAYRAANPAADIRACPSARELVAAGYGDDVEIAVKMDVSTAAPVLNHEGFFSH